MVTNYLTNSGRQLVAKMLASQRLVYTRAVTSADTVAQPEALTALPNERQTATALTVEQQSDYATISASFSCSNLAAAYQLSMVGIYAKIEGTTTDVLYMVTVYDPSDGAVTLPAGQDITYRFIIYDAVANGTLSVTVADSASAPYEHVPNPYRHIVTQTNSSTTAAVANAGDFKDWAVGQKIVFIPAATLVGNSSTLQMSGTTYALRSVDLAGNTCTCLFVPNKPYVLTYSAAGWTYVKHNEIETVSGVQHYWTGTAWKTVTPAGIIVTSAASVAPPGTLLCDGSSVSRTTYAELFTAIGTSYGSDDETTFKLPDLRGRCGIGSSTDYALGTQGGAATVALSTSQLPSHNHTVTGTIVSSSHSHDTTVTVAAHEQHRHINGIYDDQTALWVYGYTTFGEGSHAAIYRENETGPIRSGYTSTGGPTTHTVTVTNPAVSHSHSVSLTCSNSGSGNAHPNMQPYLALNYYIHTGRSLL